METCVPHVADSAISPHQSSVWAPVLHACSLLLSFPLLLAAFVISRRSGIAHVIGGILIPPSPVAVADSPLPASEEGEGEEGEGEEGAVPEEEGSSEGEEGAVPEEEGATPVEEGASEGEEGAVPEEEGATPAEEGATE